MLKRRSFAAALCALIALPLLSLSAQQNPRTEIYGVSVEPMSEFKRKLQLVESARRTLFLPAIWTGKEWTSYKEAEFQKLRISLPSFLIRAQAVADQKLASLQPEWIKDSDGKIVYAVYRGPDPIYASLLIAPSLATRFKQAFGEVWLLAPDRNALYIFPAGAENIAPFAADLEERYQSNHFSVSPEIFTFNASGELQAVGQFTE